MTNAPPTSSARLIVGCGYLGQRVAQRWQDSATTLYATTRSPTRAAQLEQRGIRPLIGDVTAPVGEATALPDLPAVDTVLWAVGFDRSAAASYHDVHVGGLARLLDRLPGTPRVIFASSTGVWGDTQAAFVNEATPPCPSREAGRVLVEAEDLLRQHPRGPGIALRFAGLYGPDRLPRLADLREGRPIPADPESWLNLIHIDDAAQVVCDLAAHPTPRPLYVVADGSPLRRRAWYEGLAMLSGSPSPQWQAPVNQSRGGDKRVDPRQLWHDLGHGPTHPDALDAVRQLL